MVAILRYCLLACNTRWLTHEGIKLFECWEVWQQLMSRIINEAPGPLFPLKFYISSQKWSKWLYLTLPAPRTHMQRQNVKFTREKHEHEAQWIKMPIKFSYFHSQLGRPLRASTVRKSKPKM
jgi:hypothetical protein